MSIHRFFRDLREVFRTGVVPTATSPKPPRESATPARAGDTRWKCGKCDKWHDELPFAYGPKYPDHVFTIPEEERQLRVEEDDDFCTVDDQHHYVRGRLEIPVVDAPETFAWDVWVSLGEKDYQRTIELLDVPGRESEQPYPGFLANHLQLYPDTTRLPVLVQTRAAELVPTITLLESNHPLASEQRNGITLERVREIATQMLHRPGH